MAKALSLLITITLTMSLILMGCSNTANEEPSNSGMSGGAMQQTAQTTATTDTTIDSFDFSITNRDQDASYDEATATRISFNTANQVETITEEGTYIVSGSSEGGQLIVDLTNAADPENAKAQVVLDGVSLSNSSAPALLVAQADKVFITLAAGSTNTLSDGSGRTDVVAVGTETTEDDSNENATLYSHDDLTINGTGTLTVTSTNHHGIKCQDDLVIADGIISVTAGVDGIRGKDSVKIANGTIAVQAGDDGIVSTQTDAPYEKGFVSITGGSITVDAVDDGVKAEALVRLAGGSVQVTNSTEGVEACLVWIEGGVHHLVSSDDGINAAGDIRTDYLLNIIGGTIYVDAEGDGIDSNNTLTQSGGTVVVAGPTVNFDEGAIDAEFSASATGGTMLALDNSGMPTTYGSESTQGSLLYALSSTQPAGSRISLVDSNGTVLFSLVAPKEFKNLAYSSPQLTVGESYHFVVGGELSGASATVEHAQTQGSFGFEYHEGGSLSGGETLTSFSLSEQVAQISSDGSVSAYSGGMMGGMGGGPGGGMMGEMGGTPPDGEMGGEPGAMGNPGAAPDAPR